MREPSVSAVVFLRATHRVVGRAARSMVAIGALAFLSSCASTPFYEYPPAMPVVMAPEAGVTLRTGESVEFVWNRPADTESFDFHVFNAENSDIARYMKTDLAAANICSAERCSINLYLALPESNRHAWRVRASNVAGKSAWTRTLFSFTDAAAQ